MSPPPATHLSPATVPGGSISPRAQDTRAQNTRVQDTEAQADIAQLGLALLLHLTAAKAGHRSDGLQQLRGELAALGLRELRALAAKWQEFCSLSLDCDRALQQLHRVQAQIQNEDCINSLIALGAPFSLMAHICNLDWQSYIRRGGSCRAGRPRLPTAAEARRIDQSLNELRVPRNKDGTATLNAFQWLALARMTRKIPLRVTWGWRSQR